MNAADTSRCAIRSVPGYDSPALRGAAAAILAADAGLASWRLAPDPGRLVVVKPNWIQESAESRPDVWEPVITHPAVVLAVAAELAAAMGGEGTLCVCDAPHTYARWDAILDRGGFRAGWDALRARFPRVRWECIDLRREVWTVRDGVVVDRRPNAPDPRGYEAVNLGRDSLLFGHAGEGRYYGADYDTSVVNRHHRGETQEYLLSGTAMRADLFVNVAKLKTHKKTGLTCCLKNLVGINGDKNWLPHFVRGFPRDGGDEFPDAGWARRIEGWGRRAGQRVALAVPVAGPWLYRHARRAGVRALGGEGVIRNGNWRGNDTCWRMALDLNRALLYGRPGGAWAAPDAPRRCLAIVDGIVGGEGNGPLDPDPAPSGVLFGGAHPAAVDAVACRLMGCEPERVSIVRRAFDAHRWPLGRGAMEEIVVDDGRVGREVPWREVAPALSRPFRPHFGWA